MFSASSSVHYYGHDLFPIHILTCSVNINTLIHETQFLLIAYKKLKFISNTWHSENKYLNFWLYLFIFYLKLTPIMWSSKPANTINQLVSLNNHHEASHQKKRKKKKKTYLRLNTLIVRLYQLISIFKLLVSCMILFWFS